VTGWRFEAIYASRLAAGRPGWRDDAVTGEVPGYLRELLDRSGWRDPPPGARALELGCGTGRLTAELGRAGFAALGLDISPAAITSARQRAGERAEFEVHDVTRPRPDLAGRFDLVLDGLALHCLTSPAARRAALRFAVAALRPGGVLLVMTVCGDPPRVPPGSVFDPGTRLLTTRGVPEAYYATAGELARLPAVTGLTRVYARVAGGPADPGLYLGAFRSAIRR
jgi:SAM-dependent methyltransferase